jgi:DNA mismatch repair protein MutS2
MLPTFELNHGVPGASSALAVALRFGIPENVVSYARRVLPEQSRAFDEVVRELDTQRQELARAQADVEAERRLVAAERADVRNQLEKIAQRGNKAVDEESRKLRELLRTAANEIKEGRRALRKHSDAEAIEAQRRLVRAAEESLPQPSVVGEGAPVTNVTPGQRVYVPRLRTHADVLEGPTRNKVRVAAGPLKLWVKTSELRASTEQAKQGTAQRPKPEPQEPRVDPKTSDNTLNLRGLRVDDALTLVETFLDRVYGSGGSTAYLSHGIGTGALRDAIRKQLSRDTVYAASYRGGDMEEGGERMTVVTLR